ncbi:SMP-30/gluconolactonase/LRE family protein [Edaphobacter sp.]|uniref:SMP-30/gluconolactonase/LRE family protein n=1 Tax=Edaphobacter sp. TaxID=1934404 RepID=UPI002DB85DB8|nr:SMP-30/gluconolactonase/LRE family protein [Edaphobacter sp.]HEU5340656.1 SMP-30/gluconolactonase/LRE family protein [Edaphobacter sp.]
MPSRRNRLAFFTIAWIFSLLISATISHAQVSYTTTWVGNTYSTIPTYVGNAMRSMWVAPEGIVYTASMWDESQGSINVYQNGNKITTIGLHGEAQGGAISGDATDLFSALQFNTTLGGSGFIGRYNRSTGVRDLTWSASSDKTERRADVITGIADTGTLVYVSDHPDNLVRCYTTAGVWQSDWSLTDPGAIAIDGSGNIWVAQMKEGTIQEFAPSGNMLNTINMGSSSRPSALYYDAANNQLMVGDQGPNMNIQIYGNLSSTPSVVGTFGVQGGYLDTTTGNKGQTGSQRFTRIVGIGKDAAGNLYVLNNPWGGTWDLGRNGKTDLHAYNSSGVLQYTVQALNFEGAAAFDPATDGAYLYSGQDVYHYTGSGAAGYVGNSVDALDNPTDPRVDVTSQSRGFDFGLMASVNGHRILAAAGQNSDAFLFSYFPTNQYISVPFGSLPGQASAAGYNYANYFNTTARIRNGFCLDTNGDIWVGLDKTNAISHYPLTGFDANGLPIWGPPTTTPTPSTIAPLGGIEYIPSTDTMVLMNANGTDWTSLGGRVEVYHGWKAGHTTNPDLVINLKTAQNPKGRAAAGNYLFISYVHTVPDIDAYNLTTGADDLTMTSADPNVAVGNDVDSMYGIRAYQTSTGDYLISKDNYNENSIVIHRMTVAPTPDFSVSATPSSQTVTQGDSTTYTATVGALNGFTDTVDLSVGGLPAGATASFNPASITTSGSSTLTVSAASTTPPGTYTLTITGATSTLSRTATVMLIVPGPPDFSTTASPSSQTVMQGNSTTYTASIAPLSGFTGTVNLSVSGLPAGATASFNPALSTASGSSTLTVSTASTTPSGTYPLTITGTDGTLSHSATITLVVATPDFSIAAAPSSQTAVPGNSATYTTTIGALNGFTNTVNLSVNGLPTGATASFNPASISASGSSTLTVSTATTTPTGTYTLTITGTDGSLSRSTTITLVVNTNSGGLPAGWKDQDVGTVSLAGSATYSNGTFTVNGAGASIGGTADQFNYAYQAVTGTDYTITARVVSLTNTNSGAQAGVMVRETLDAGSTMADINVTPANGVTWIYRSTTGAGGNRTPGLVTPYWVRVVRSGSTFTGYYSADGMAWTQQGTVAISMANNAYIGLVVSSRAGSELATATFDNVSITTPNKQSLTITPQSATTTYGSAATTLTATATFSGATPPSGSLVFQVGSGSQMPGVCTVSGDTETCTVNYPTAGLAAGNSTITVTYAGDTNYAPGSASATLTVSGQGNVQLVTTTALALQNDGSYQATVTVSNTGGSTAQNVVLTGVSVGSASGTPVPQSLGNIAPGGFVTSVVSVPASAGAPGSAAVVKATGTYTGGTFGGSFRTTLP